MSVRKHDGQGASLRARLELAGVTPLDRAVVAKTMEEVRLSLYGLPAWRRKLVAITSPTVVFGGFSLAFVAYLAAVNSVLLPISGIVATVVGIVTMALFAHRDLSRTPSMMWLTCAYDDYVRRPPSDPVPLAVQKMVRDIKAVAPKAEFRVQYLYKDPWIHVEEGAERYYLRGWIGDTIIL